MTYELFVLPPDGNFSSAQDSISAAVAKTLRIQPASGRTTALAQRGTINREAYDLFLRGQYHLVRNDNRGAVTFLQQAVARDPTFARAHAWLAIASASLPNAGVGSPDSALVLAEKSVDRSTALDSNLVDGQLAIATIRLSQMRFAEAEQELAALLRRDPDNPDLHSFYAFALGMQGHIVEALEEQRHAHTLDPNNAGAYLAMEPPMFSSVSRTAPCVHLSMVSGSTRPHTATASSPCLAMVPWAVGPTPSASATLC